MSAPAYADAADHADPHAVGRGRLPPRARFVSYPTADAARVGGGGGASPWEESLEGTWGFRLYERPQAVPADWAAQVGGDAMEVPSHWQLAGTLTPTGGTYGRLSRPHYTNWAYPFPIDPPHVPDDVNPTGVYSRTFSVPDAWRGMRIVLRSDGIDGCATVAINGREIGMTKGSRLMSEFDVTSHLVPGENRLAVRVIQYGDHSYIEKQDMWWLSGIFRGVSLIAEPAGAAHDVAVSTPRDADGYALDLHATSDVRGVALFDAAGTRVAAAESSGQCVRVSGLAVTEWSHDTPVLYRLVVERAGDVPSFIGMDVGFRTVDAEGGILRLNGRPVTLRGVNRHEWSATRGRSLTPQDMLDDVLLMKRHNVNTVRTSHYPPHPHFLELCDRHGLLVIDECDLESHGMNKAEVPYNLSSDPAWRAAHLDRIERTVSRDRNHACVVMWSLGNECTRGDNLTAMAARARELDPTRLVHYEGDWRAAATDVVSKMYLDTASLDLMGRGEGVIGHYGETFGPDDYAGRPVFLCEYAHAMGNGPGGLHHYWDVIDRHPNLCGGCVWEWIDHGLVTHRPDGRTQISYGGDFGEVPHDGNFVLDGLCDALRRPTPGLVELKQVYAPVRVTHEGGTTLRVTPRDAGATLAPYAFAWEQSADGVAVAAGTLDVSGDGKATIPNAPAGVGERFVRIVVTRRDATSWCDAGHEVASFQFPLPPGVDADVPAAKDVRIEIDDAKRTVRLPLPGGFGHLPRLTLWRSPIDNEARGSGASVGKAWAEFGLAHLRRRTNTITRDGAAVIVTETLGPAIWEAACDVTSRVTPVGPGVRVDVSGTFRGKWPDLLPRIALASTLPATFGRVTWLGMGPGENYRDSHTAAHVARHALDVDDLHTDYARPQDNGLRTGVRWASFTDPAGTGVLAAFADLGDLQAHRYTTADLDAATHACDLPRRDTMVVHLGYAHNGLGSHSCGPPLDPRDRLTPGPFAFSVALAPLSAGDDAAGLGRALRQALRQAMRA